MITDWDVVPLSVGLKQTAAILGVSERTIQRQLATGRMQPAPQRRIGRDWKWSKAKLRAFIDGPVIAEMRRHSRVAVLLLTLLAWPLVADAKPAGIFQIGSCDATARPAWAAFALVADTSDLVWAADCSRASGIRWVLYLTSSPYQPVEAHARAVKARADAAGLTPHLLAVVWLEEWYEHVLGGAWKLPGLDPTHYAHARQLIAIVHAWAGQQYLVLQRVFGLPTAWITNRVDDNPAHGLSWRPLPAGVSVIALEAYVPDGHTWDATVGSAFAAAVATRTEPVVLVGQGFQWVGHPMWSSAPRLDDVTRFGALLAHPRVWGAWLFTWDGRLYGVDGLLGLSQLPAVRDAFARAIGVEE